MAIFKSRDGAQPPNMNLGEIFSPSAPIESIEQFVGRDEIVYAACEALTVASAVPVIVGPPGIGKTSVLNALTQVLWGDEDAVSRFSVGFALPSIGGAVVVRLDGKGAWRTIDDLCAEAVGRLPELPWETPHTFRLRRFVGKAGTALVGGEIEIERADGEEQEDGLQRLVRTADRLHAEHGTSLVVMVDEIELVPDPEAMCLEICRAARPTSALKFVLGARDYSLKSILGKDHAGVRQYRKLDVRPLSDDAISEILQSGFKLASKLDLPIDVSDQAMRYIVRQSLGEPWYAQMIGSQLVSDRIRQDGADRDPYQLADLKRVEREAVQARLSAYKALYDRVAERAPIRSALIRGLARFPESVIPPSYVSIVRARIGNTRNAMQWLLNRPDDPILTVVDGGFSFVSQQFRLFCRFGVQGYDHEITQIDIDIDRWRKEFG